ncbi:MAG: large conductance mechanosensitive channel protein MscL [Clostridiales bacterium]|jgi:large conductance mechanosensitive channel|nr:large conductance mechanosensitive channel protein MscL [Clostridiales bacterium]
MVRVKKFFRDFKAFVTKGNILDLAVAVIIGGAFGKIVTSLVNDIIMPLITLTVGGVSVKDWKWIIREAVFDNAGNVLTAESAVNYGNFIQAIIDFLVIAFFIFLALRLLMNIKKHIAILEEGLTYMSKKETKALIKELRAQGLKGKPLKIELDKREKEKDAAQKAELAEKTAKAEAEKPETQEKILADIRALLKNAADNGEKTDKL